VVSASGIEGDTDNTASEPKRAVFEPMDKGSGISVKVVSRDFDLDTLDVELESKVIFLFFTLHLGGSTEERALDGKTAVGDDACAGEFRAEVRVERPSLEFVVGVTELFRGTVATESA